MAFKDLREFFDGSLRLPVGGKTYTIPPISAADGLWATALMDVAVKAKTGGDVSEGDVEKLNLDDDEERSLYQRMLGPVFDELVADGVDWPSIARCGLTALMFFTTSEEAAQRAWEGMGEAPAPNRAARRAGKGSGSKTKTQGSTAGTTRPKGNRAKAASASGGASS